MRILQTALACVLFSGLALADPAVTKTALNLREGPSTAYPVRRVLEPGRTVYVLQEIYQGEGKGWAKVLYGEELGYVNTEYLNENDPRGINLDEYQDALKLPGRPASFGMWLDDRAPHEEVYVRLFPLEPDYFLQRDHAKLAFTGPPSRSTRPLRLRQEVGDQVFLELPPLEPGQYLLALADPAAPNAVLGAMAFQVTDLAVVFKAAPAYAQFWAVDLATGEPRPGTRLELFVEEGEEGAKTLRPLGQATTDADGLARIPAPRASELRFRAEGNGSKAFSFFAQESAAGTVFRTLVLTDRPLYQPKDTVQVSGAVRQVDGPRYRPYSGEATLRLVDEGGNRVLERPLKLDGAGNFSEQIPLQLSWSGNYALQVHIPHGGELRREPLSYAGHASFTVQPYVKPAFRVELRGPREAVAGKVPFVLEGEYYSGGRLKAQADVFAERGYRGSDWDYYTATRTKEAFDEQDYTQDDPPDPYWISGGYYAYEDPQSRLAQVAVEQGRARFELPLASRDGEVTPYTVTVHAKDEFGRIVPATAEVEVHPSGLALGVGPVPDLALERPLRLKVFARRVGTAERLPNRTVRARVIRSTWEFVPRDGWRERVLQTERFSLTTDARGEASLTYTPKGPGSVRLELEAQDSQGRVARTLRFLGYLPVPGLIPPSASDHDRPEFDLLGEERLYRVGETARFTLRSDLPEGSVVLLSLEGREVYRQQLLRVEGKQTVIPLPITPELEPGFTLRLEAVRDGRSYRAEREVFVPVPGKRLEVKVSVPGGLRPGQRVTLNVQTTLGGQPVAAWVGVGAVHRAVYALQEDLIPDPWRFFWGKPHNAVRTAFSFLDTRPDGLGGGGGDGAGVYLRQNFRDTAFFAAVRTDAQGRASLQVELPDDLAEYRLLARAVSPDTAVGEYDGAFRVEQPVYLRLSTPTFLTRGDRTTAYATLHNLTAQTQVVKLTLSAGGRGEARSVSVLPQSTLEVPWPLQAPENADRLSLEARAEGKHPDAVRLALPVRERGEELELTRLSQSATGLLTDRFTLPAEARQAELRLWVAPSPLAAALANPNDLLGHEDPAEALLTAYWVWKGLSTLGLPTDAARQQVQSNLSALSAARNEDGGWGWRPGARSNPLDTIRTVQALAAARLAGFDDYVIRDLDRTLEYLEAQQVMSNDLRWALYQLGVLSREELLEALSRRPLTLPQMARLAAELTPRPDAYARLAAEQKRDSAGLSIGQSIEATAYALLGALALNSPDAPAYAGWLANELQSSRYRTPRQAALAGYALAEYLEARQLTGSPGPLQITLNGRSLTQLGSLPALGAPLRFPAVALGPDNTLELRATGPVALLRRVIYQTPRFVPPPPADFTLERSYSTNETERFGVVEVRLRLRLTLPRERLRLEDPYPAGFEPTSSLPYPSALGPDGNYYASTSLLDDRAVFLFEKLPAGEYVVGYKLRALSSGTYFAAPPRLFLVNEPKLYALGSSGQLTVR